MQSRSRKRNSRIRSSTWRFAGCAILNGGELAAFRGAGWPAVAGTEAIGVAAGIVIRGFTVAAGAATCGAPYAGWPELVGRARGVASVPSAVSKPPRALEDASSGTVAAAAACEAFDCCCNDATGCAAVCVVSIGENPGADAGSPVPLPLVQFPPQATWALAEAVLRHSARQPSGAVAPPEAAC